jgi:hypothetical protein
VTAVRVTAADTGYPLPVITAGEKVFSNSLDPFEAKLPECIGIFPIIPAAEIGEMTLKDGVKGVFSPRKVLGLLLFQYGSILYAHIKYYCENGTENAGKSRFLPAESRFNTSAVYLYLIFPKVFKERLNQLIMNVQRFHQGRMDRTGHSCRF